MPPPHPTYIPGSPPARHRQGCQAGSSWCARELGQVCHEGKPQMGSSSGQQMDVRSTSGLSLT